MAAGEGMIRRLIRQAGLVSQGELRATQDKLRQVRERLERTLLQVTDATAAAALDKRGHAEEIRRYAQKLATLNAEHEREVSRTRDAAAKAAQRVAELEEELRRRDAGLADAAREAASLEARVEAATQDLERAREHLRSFEMKLSILEGAANVLDLRLRAARQAVADDPR